MYYPANKGFIWLIFYKPFYEYMNGKLSFGAMLRRMPVRWLLLGAFAITFFVWFFTSENPNQDMNMPAMVTSKQWADMKARKAAGMSIYRPAGPDDAAWANVLDHLAIVPGPPTIATPVVTLKNTYRMQETPSENIAAHRVEEEERLVLSTPIQIPGHKTVPFSKDSPSFFAQLRAQWKITQKQKAEGR